MRKAKYLPGLFKNKYPTLSGFDWVRTIEPEDLRVFVDIGLRANDHGRLGGQALAKDRQHMGRIGRIGAIVTNSKKLWNRLLREEVLKEFNIDLDY